MWEDKGTYWAWRGAEKDYCKPPTTKRLDYLRWTENGLQRALCIGVWDDEKYTSLHRAELERQVANGFELGKMFGAKA